MLPSSSEGLTRQKAIKMPHNKLIKKGLIQFVIIAVLLGMAGALAEEMAEDERNQKQIEDDFNQEDEDIEV